MKLFLKCLVILVYILEAAKKVEKIPIRQNIAQAHRTQSANPANQMVVNISVSTIEA